MKCPNCGYENNDFSVVCQKCKKNMTEPPVWFPNWKWHIKALSWIYIVLIAGFFTVSYLLHKLPPPYDQRSIPAEMTPWLNHPVTGGNSSAAGKAEAESSSAAPAEQKK